MGQKDYQQCMVIKSLIDLMGIGTRLVTRPTVSEIDGLANSSRNLRLSPKERAHRSVDLPVYAGNQQKDI